MLFIFAASKLINNLKTNKMKTLAIAGKKVGDVINIHLDFNGFYVVTACTENMCFVQYMEYLKPSK